MAFDYEHALARIPDNPGVYLMIDERETVIYVGKAKNLNKRVRQYFTGHDERAFVSILDQFLNRIDVIITHTEREALILEAGLIKRYRPRFNVLLKDDKDMPQLRIDLHEPWPRVEIVRRRKKDGAHYYGPYPDARACRKSLDVINRYFHLRSCRDAVFKNRSRPCLQYEIHRCPAPCVFDINRDDYLNHCKDAEMFLSGKYTDLTKELETRMNDAAEQLAFEQAASYRDQIKAIHAIRESQKIVQKMPVNQDFWAVDGAESFRAVVVMMVRDGRLQSMQTYEAHDSVSELSELLPPIMVNHYQMFEDWPREIILDPSFQNIADLLSATFSDMARKKIILSFPQNGIKAQLLSVAYTNAHQQFIQRRTNEDNLLERVQHTLNLSHYPHRIECYDISNMQGGQIVAAMVVFIEGRLDTSRCRTFKIKSTNGQDDFGSLNEVLSRRLRYLTHKPDNDNVRENEQSFCEMPDLLLIDGGHGQVHAVCDAVELANMRGAFDIIGIGKARMQDENDCHEIEHSPERLYYPNVPDPLILDQSAPEILLMAHIRDETHARAIGFHRKQRLAAGMHSQLDDIDGIGPKRKAALLKTFGSIKEIAAHTPQAITDATGIPLSIAQKLLENL